VTDKGSEEENVDLSDRSSTLYTVDTPSTRGDETTLQDDEREQECTEQRKARDRRRSEGITIGIDRRLYSGDGAPNQTHHPNTPPGDGRVTMGVGCDTDGSEDEKNRGEKRIFQGVCDPTVTKLQRIVGDRDSTDNNDDTEDDCHTGHRFDNSRKLRETTGRKISMALQDSGENHTKREVQNRKRKVDQGIVRMATRSTVTSETKRRRLEGKTGPGGPL